jgi:2,4-dienoyl-CoA reductase-like NADH-dependent reductase (Old Yellow Enzyme family)
MVKLFEPLQLRGLEIRNRIFIAPMCTYSCEDRDGMPSQWHLVHLGSRAGGGAGLIIAEATAVSPEGRITPWCMGLWNEAQAAAWLQINQFIHTQGAKSAIQLAHAGRKASTYREGAGSGSVPESDGGWQTISATSAAFAEYAAPRELETQEIKSLAREWADSAKLAVAAGFDAIELHAAHGYLIHQFLSPITNQRVDEYGGSLENRARLLLEILSAVRASIPEDMPVLVRLSATDYRQDGWTVEQCAEVASWCANAGADLFDISSGGLVTGVSIPSGPGYQVPLAEFVADRVEEPVAAVGQITDAHQAEAILQGGLVEVISIARASLRDPYWPLRAAHELGVDVDYWPRQSVRGKWPN